MRGSSYANSQCPAVDPFTVAWFFSTVCTGSNCVGSRSQPADHTICAHRVENPGRGFQRNPNCNYSNYGWLSMDWNAGLTHAFRWGPIRSMEADEWKNNVVILH